MKAFQWKQALFSKQLIGQNFFHFPLLKKSSDNYSSKLTTLQQEFVRKFVHFKAVVGLFDFLNSSFASDIKATTEEIPIKLINLQAGSSLKMRFEGEPQYEFYVSLH